MLVVLGGCGPEPMMDFDEPAGTSTGAVMGSSSDGAEEESGESTGEPATRLGTSGGDESSTGAGESSTGCEDPGECLDAASPLGASCEESCLAAGWMCQGAEAFDGACGESGEGAPVDCTTTIGEIGEGCLYLRCECGHG